MMMILLFFIHFIHFFFFVCLVDDNCVCWPGVCLSFTWGTSPFFFSSSCPREDIYMTSMLSMHVEAKYVKHAFYLYIHPSILSR